MRIDRHLAAALLVLAPTAGGAQGGLPTVQRELVIGCESCGGALQFAKVADVAVTARGEVIVADLESPMLRRFDPAGKVAWQGGAPGGGPGEYRTILRLAPLPGGGVLVVDMGSLRVTELAADHRVVRTTPLQRFPTTAAAGGAGELVLGIEGPRGTFDVVRWRAGVATPITLPRPARGGDGPVAHNASLALSPSGVLAALPHNERYDIVRLDSAGRRLADLRRDVERVRNTPDEEAEARARMGKGMAAMHDVMRARGATPSSGRALDAPPAGERMLKPHVAADAMRYDPAGRLWVQTGRGDETRTVFDVFAPAGTFLGSVTIPGRVRAFALGGRWLVTAAESEDGVPQVTRWAVNR